MYRSRLPKNSFLQILYVSFLFFAMSFVKASGLLASISAVSAILEIVAGLNVTVLAPRGMHDAQHRRNEGTTQKK